MSQKSAKTKPVPIILRKDDILFNNWKVPSIASTQLIRETVIYESVDGEYFKGEYRNINLVNKYNVLNNTSRTVARYETNTGAIVERTSDNVTKLIGQANYDILFSSLCSVISQELRVRSLLSILTVPNKCAEDTTQTDISLCTQKTDNSSQTEDCMEIFNKKPQRKRSRRQQLAPYVVQDIPADKAKLKRLVIKPEEFKQKYLKEDSREETRSTEQSDSQASDTESQLTESCDTSLPELKGTLCLDETSRDSISNISIVSGNIPDAVLSLDLFKEIDKHTEINTVELKLNVELFPVRMLDGNIVYVPGKPESIFHIATKENLKQMSLADKQKLLYHQAYIDWKYCLLKSPDGNLPIHDAVLNNDTELLRRHCLVLTKIRRECVDLPNADNITPLQMALRQDNATCLSILLASGADPLAADSDRSTPLHTAAEGESTHLKVILDYCKVNAKKILFNDKDLWKSRFENSSDEALGKYLLHLMNTTFDDQGYTPLMLASRLGKYQNVEVLLEYDPSCVDIMAPNSGDTALYQAVRAACLDATKRGNTSTVASEFRKTLTALIHRGANPSIQNLSGFSSNDLVTEGNNSELSTIVAQSVAAFNSANLPPGCTVNNMMILTPPSVVNRRKLTPKKADKTANGKKDFNKMPDECSEKELSEDITLIEGVKDTHSSIGTVRDTPKDFLGNFKSFISKKSLQSVVIIKDEKITPSLKINTPSIGVAEGVKRKAIPVSVALKKKKK